MPAGDGVFLFLGAAVSLLYYGWHVREMLYRKKQILIIIIVGCFDYSRNGCVGYYSLRPKKWPATETLWGKPLGCFYCVVSKFISLGREPVEDFFPTITGHGANILLFYSALPAACWRCVALSLYFSYILLMID